VAVAQSKVISRVTVLNLMQCNAILEFCLLRNESIVFLRTCKMLTKYPTDKFFWLFYFLR